MGNVYLLEPGTVVQMPVDSGELHVVCLYGMAARDNPQRHMLCSILQNY